MVFHIMTNWSTRQQNFIQISSKYGINFMILGVKRQNFLSKITYHDLNMNDSQTYYILHKRCTYSIHLNIHLARLTLLRIDFTIGFQNNQPSFLVQ